MFDWLGGLLRADVAPQAPLPLQAAPKVRNDGWMNVLTGLGLATRDKRLSSSFQSEFLSRDELEELYRGDDMAARIVDTLPDEMLREGFEVVIENDKDASEATMALIDDLSIVESIHAALRWARCFGGSGVLLGVDDAEKDLSQPLNLNSIRSFSWVLPLTPAELIPAEWYDDPTQPKYGEVRLYNVQDSTFGTADLGTRSLDDLPAVHESRIIRFDGVKLSRRQQRMNNGWGDSVLVRCNSVLRDFQMSWAGAATLLHDFAQAVFKIEGLAELVGSNSTDVIISRAQLVDMTRSIARAVIIDSKEDFERKATPISGLPEMLQQMALRLSATARMPVSMLMGQAPAGLNATGASDIRFFYDQVSAEQRRILKPALNQILKCLFNAKNGPTHGKEPENWCVEFNPLWQLTEGEWADIRLKQAQADRHYVDAGILAPEEVANSRFGGDAYSVETTLDQSSRQAMAQMPATLPPSPSKAPPGRGASTNVVRPTNGV